MYKEDYMSLLLEEDEDEAEDYVLPLIRKNSKLHKRVTETYMHVHTTNANVEAPENGDNRTLEDQNGNFSVNGDHGSLPFVAESNGGHQETENSSFYYDTDEDGEDRGNTFVTNNEMYISVDIPHGSELPMKMLHDADTINVKDSNGDSILTNGNKTLITKTDMNIQSEITTETEGAGTEVSSQITKEEHDSRQPVAEQRILGRRGYAIEIFKSIVYGGLDECITSLSVISSSAGGGAATLNTLALQLANLIGGIFIIFHNLCQLKNDRPDDAVNQVPERINKYRELLGMRQNFVLHAFVAILSYLLVGSMAPAIFYFSFRKSDHKELKLLAVAVASFLCILVLATLKAYVQRPPQTYIRTVVCYLIIGVIVSGVSYGGGKFFEWYLDKLGLFKNLGSVPTLSTPVKPPTNQAWASF
ncbi:transporter [Lithospermum erythrorhizon]|uniref:Transporter n=1 Tax=Lithospermum erythrorhizon TaxID=34254 RepID=A0AAV3PDX2_LITER